MAKKIPLMEQGIHLKTKNKSVGEKIPDHLSEIYDLSSDVETIITEDPKESEPKKEKPKKQKEYRSRKTEIKSEVNSNDESSSEE